jgi:hypothetical protein
MFPGWSRQLHGRPPANPALSLKRQTAKLSDLCLRQAEDLFGCLLPVSLFGLVPKRRERLFPLPVVFWTFVCQIFAAASCRGGVASVQVLLSRTGKALCSPNTAAFCKARVRIPIRLLVRFHRHLAAGLCTRRGPRTFVIDGTTLSMPDTPENQARWPQTRSQEPGCGFPIMRVVGLFDLLTGVWIALAKGDYLSHERNLCRRLWRHLQPGDTLVADSGFCCWFTFAMLQRKGVRVVMRNHARRLPDPRAVRLGKHDRLERWLKPQRPKWLDRATYKSLPRVIAVRVLQVTVDPGAGFRTRELHLATTVTDPADLPAEEMAGLYLRRWQVELFLDDAKTTLGLAVLRTRSPAMIQRELLMHVIAYNLVRALILRAGPPSGASFKGTLDRMTRWLPELSAAVPAKTRRRLVEDLLEAIAEDLVPERPYRREPRVLKRRPKPFQLMNKPRSEMVETPHRAKRGKRPQSALS